MTIQPFGSNALLVNFEQKIDLQINQKVIELYRQIKKMDWEAITFLIPAYCSLTIGFDSNKIVFKELQDRITKLPQDINNTELEVRRKIKIPVCYSLRFGLDLAELEQTLALNVDEIIRIHSSTRYHVYMLGFLPGFPYMGSLSNKINTARKEKPRIQISRGSVGIAGAQTGIYPTNAPGGWQIIGKTPLNIFDASKNNPFLFQPGDEVLFESIDEMAFETISMSIKEGTFNEKSIYA